MAYNRRMGRNLSRRTVLKGMGTAMSLPLLEGMLPTSALAQSVPAAQRPVRMAFLFVPNGMHMEHWTPKSKGLLGELPATLKPLEKVESSINVISGLAQRNAFALGDGPGDHARCTAVWLTGVNIK